VELVCQLSASSEGMPAAAKTHPVIVLFTVQGLLRITNRAGKLFMFKERVTSYQLIAPRTQILKKKFYKYFCAGG